MKVLEICPYEPPTCGWVTRVKLLRRLIQEQGGTCEILDIGPSRKVVRPGCLPVMSGLDYLAKVVQFAKKGYVMHCHVNGEYFRGLLLGLSASLIARLFGNRCLVTFHGGKVQIFLSGWRRLAVGPIFRLIFSLAHVVICNSKAVKAELLAFRRGGKIEVIPAFSRQYLEYAEIELNGSLGNFLTKHSPAISTYLCFREGFYTDVLIEAMGPLVRAWPDVGLVIVGTGDGITAFKHEVDARQLQRNIYLAGDLGHDAFMTLISKSDVHLRTPITDGVSSTVLEALSLRIPVVAGENGSRPPGVLTYEADNPQSLAAALNWTLEHHNEVVATMPPTNVEDTARREVDLLLGHASRFGKAVLTAPDET